MGTVVMIGGALFAIAGFGWLVHGGMEWRQAAIAVAPFAFLAAAFGWIFRSQKDRSAMWLSGIWGVVCSITLLVSSCSGK